MPLFRCFVTNNLLQWTRAAIEGYVVNLLNILKIWQSSLWRIIIVQMWYTYYKLNLLFVSISGVQRVAIDDSFQQEKIRIQEIRRDQEAARTSDSRLHRKEGIDSKKRRPNQSVPGSKLSFCVIFVDSSKHQLRNSLPAKGWVQILARASNI